MSKTFEYAYFCNEDVDISIQNISAQVSKDRNILEKYKGKLFCPECREAKLSFVSKTNKKVAHFRMTQNEHHKYGCSYIQDYATNDNVTSYIKNLTDLQIKDKLNSIMNMLCKGQDNNLNKIGGLEKDRDNPMVISTSKDNISYSLRRKSLSGWLDVDEKQIYVFYGKVRLSVDKKKGKYGDFYVLHIKTKNKNGEWNNKVNISSSKEFCGINEEYIYRIAMIGKLRKEYMSISLLKNNSIIYEIMQEKQ